jgi:hypothetical protein
MVELTTGSEDSALSESDHERMMRNATVATSARNTTKKMRQFVHPLLGPPRPFSG